MVGLHYIFSVLNVETAQQDLLNLGCTIIPCLAPSIELFISGDQITENEVITLTQFWGKTSYQTILNGQRTVVQL